MCDGLKVSWEKVGLLSRCFQATPIVGEVEIEFAVAFDVVVVAGLAYAVPLTVSPSVVGRERKPFHICCAVILRGNVKCGKRMHQNVFWI